MNQKQIDKKKAMADAGLLLSNPAAFYGREMILRGISAKQPDTSLKDAIMFGLGLWNSMGTASAVRYEKAFGVARKDVAERSWSDMEGFEGFWKDVSTNAYRWSDTRMMEPFGRMAYAIFESGAWDLVKDSYNRKGKTTEELAQMAINAVGATRIQDFYKSDKAADWNKNPKYQAIVNLPAEFVFDLANPLFAVQTAAVNKIQAVQRMGFWDDAAKHLISKKASFNEIADYLIKNVEGAPVAHDGLVDTFKHFVDLGDAEGFKAVGLASGGWQKTMLSELGDAFPILKYFKPARSVSNPKLVELQMEQVKIERYLAMKTNEALEKYAPLRKTISEMNPEELAAFTLINGSPAALEKWKLRKIVDDVGFVSTPTLERAVKELAEVTGFDAGERTMAWMRTKKTLADKMQGEVEAHIERYASNKGKLDDAVKSLAETADPTARAAVEKNIDLIHGEGRAIKRRITELLEAKEEILAKDAPPLMQNYVAQLKARRADVGDLEDPLQNVWAQFTTPGYLLHKEKTENAGHAILDLYGNRWKDLGQDLTKLYEGVALRAVREDGVNKWSTFISQLGKAEAETINMLARTPRGTDGHNTLLRLSDGLSEFRDNAIRHLERLPRPAAGQRTVSDFANETAKNWDEFQLKLSEARKEMGRRKDVLKSTQNRYSELLEESSQVGVHADRIRPQVDAAKKQLDKAWEAHKQAKESVEAVSSHLKGKYDARSALQAQKDFTYKVSSRLYDKLKIWKDSQMGKISKGWEAQAAKRKSTSDKVNAGWKKLEKEYESTVGKAELEYKGGREEMATLNEELKEMYRKASLAETREEKAALMEAASSFKDSEILPVQLVVDRAGEKLQTLRKFHQRKVKAWKAEASKMMEEASAGAKVVAEARKKVDERFHQSMEKISKVRKTEEFAAKDKALRMEIEDLKKVLKEKQQAVQGKFEKAQAIRKDLDKLQSPVARRGLATDLSHVRAEVDAARLAFDEASTTAGRLATMVPEPKAAMKLFDNVIDAYDTAMNLVKRNWLFGNPTRFIATNLDNFVKTFRETGLRYTPTMTRVTGEAITISPRQNFMGELSRADTRGGAGVVERSLSAARDNFPIPLKPQAEAVAWEERASRGMLYDYHYQRKAKELMESGVKSLDAVDSAASAFADREVGSVQFMGEKHSLMGRVLERVFPFSMTYGVPAVKDAMNVLLKRPMYAHTMMNMVDTLDSSGITPDGDIEIAGGVSVNPTHILGLYQTMRAADAIRLGSSGLYVGEKRDEYSIEPQPGSLSYDPDKMRAAKQMGALMSARGAPIRLSPFAALAKDIATRPFTDRQLEDGAGMQVAKPFIKSVFSPQDQWIKAAGNPQGLAGVLMKAEGIETPNYVQTKIDEIIHQGEMAGKVFSREEAFAIWKFKSQLDAVGVMTGTGLKTTTPQQREMDEMKSTYYKLPVEARQALRSSRDPNLQFIKLWPKYKYDEPKEALDRFEKSSPREALKQLQDAPPQEKKSLLEHYLQKVTDILPDGDSASVSTEELMDVLGKSKYGRMAAFLASPREAAAANVEDIDLMSRGTKFNDGATRKDILAEAVKARDEDAIAEMVVGLTNPMDKDTALAQVKKVLSEVRHPEPKFIADATADGEPLLLRGAEGPTSGAFQFYGHPKPTGNDKIDRATTMTVQLAQAQKQGAWSGLLQKFNELSAVGTKEQFMSLRTDPRYQEFFNEGPTYGGKLYDRKAMLGGFLTSPETNLSVFIKTGELPQGVSIRLAQGLKAFKNHDYWTEQLKSSAYYNPKETPAVIEAMAEDAKRGGVAPSAEFFSGMKDTNRALFERVAVTSFYPEIKASLEAITRRDPLTNRPVALDIPALRHQLAAGHVEGFAAIKAGWAGKDLQGFLERAVATEPLPDSTLGRALPFNLHEVPFDPADLGEYFVKPFLRNAGVYSAPEYAAIFAHKELTKDMAGGQVPAGPAIPLRDDRAPVDKLISTPATNVPFSPIKPNLEILDASNMSGLIREGSYTPALPVRSTPHNGLVGYWKNSVAEHGVRMQHWEAGGRVGAQPSLMASFGSNLVYTPVRGQDANGRNIMGQDQLAISPTQAGSAIAGAGQIAGAFGAFEQDDPAGRAFGGLGMGLTAYSVGSAATTALLGQAAAAGAMAGPVGIGIGVAAVGLGIAFGMMGNKKGGQGNAESLQIQRDRLALDRERFDEQLRQQSIRDLSSREQTLTRTVGVLKPSEQLRGKFLSFQRRGTFASKVGLVDAIERELASTLKPRF